jgi:hypothetical protein
MSDKRCPVGDETCPCPDGDACHYADMPGSPAMARVTMNGVSVIGRTYDLPEGWEDRGVAVEPSDP